MRASSVLCDAELLTTVFPQLAAVLVQRVVDEGRRVRVVARTRADPVPCPRCGTRTERVHGYHRRWLTDLLRKANTLVVTARAAGNSRLDQKTIDALRARYDADVRIGELTNLSRPWTDEKNHPGLVLARRLAAKADQVWLFTTNFTIPWTNNPSEQAIRLPKRHQAVSGYWHTPTTLAAYLRVRSYLVSARDHGLTAVDAIRLALAGTPWMPARRAASPTHALAT